MGNPTVGEIPDHWEATTLGEICDRGRGSIQTGPFGSQLHASDYVSVGVPSIMPVNIGDNRLVENDIKRVSENDANRLSKHRVLPGDIIYSRRGDVERRALVREPQRGWLCGTGCMKVRLGEGVVDPAFASFYLDHPQVREWIVQHAVGATMPNLNTSIMRAIPFALPPFEEQLLIASVLGSLDDNIELNRRMNGLLEGMARALFKAWFIDFEPVKAKAAGATSFPGMPQPVFDQLPNSFTNSDLGEIPEGWEASSLAEIIAIHDSKRIPLSKKQREARLGTVPYYGATGIIDYVDEPIFEGVHVLVGEDGSVVREDGTPFVQYVWGKYWVNNHAHVLKGANGVSDEYLYLFLQQVEIRPFVTGAVQAKLNQGNLKSVPCVIPAPGVLEAFSMLVHDYFSLYRASFDEISILRRIRDTLLPRLSSGELAVPATNGEVCHVE